MEYIVGLDFGTHQTKICIEDSTNRNQPMYEFLEFEDPIHNKKSVIFPSIVQINNDGTVSYGFVDISKAMCLENEPEPIKKENPKPELQELLPEPIYLSHPKEPKKEKYVGYLSVLASLLPNSDSKEQVEWQMRCQVIDKMNADKKREWEEKNKKIQEENNIKIDAWNIEQEKIDKDYEQIQRKWEEEKIKNACRYRYFKQATFVNPSIWTHKDIKPETVSVWYLTYIKFLLDEKLGKGNYLIRMGVPCAAEQVEDFSSQAFNLWSAAEKLSEEYISKEDFLAAKHDDLREKTKLNNVPYNSEVFSARTEAQASLFSIVTNRRINTPINIIVDIGGGTTDVGIFHINHNEILNDFTLEVLDTVSIPMGLNFIFEEYKKKHPELTLEDIQIFFRYNKLNHNDISNSINSYLDSVKREINKLVNYLVRHLCETGRRLGATLETLSQNPTVYCGGGSMYEKMRRISISHLSADGTGAKVILFNDKKIVGKGLIGIKNVRNKNIPENLYAILATSYGLSLAENWLNESTATIRTQFREIEQLETPSVFERNDDD